MGFQTQEEADIALTSALLYDIGRALDGDAMSENNRIAIGFTPHRKTIQIIDGELDTKDPIENSLFEIFWTGYSEDYPSLHPNLKQHSALAKIDTVVRIALAKSNNGNQ